MKTEDLSNACEDWMAPWMMKSSRKFEDYILECKIPKWALAIITISVLLPDDKTDAFEYEVHHF